MLFLCRALKSDVVPIVPMNKSGFLEICACKAKLKTWNKNLQKVNILHEHPLYSVFSHPQLFPFKLMKDMLFFPLN